MKIAIFGMGLMGGSFGRAVLKNTEHEVYGTDLNDNVLAKAELLSACTFRLTEKDLTEIDLVVLALCPKDVLKMMKEIAPKLKNGATIIDFAGNKREVFEEMQSLFAKFSHLNFVGVHPMAGREFSGISHSMATLFEHSYFVVTPLDDTPIQVVADLKSLFLQIGAEGVQIATAEEHDKMIAYTSQLAHVISNAYIRNPLAEKHSGFSAGSFRDMTRVSKLNGEMWTELFLENKDFLLEEIEIFEKNIAELKNAIQNGNRSELENILNDGTKMKELAELNRRNRRKND